MLLTRVVGGGGHVTIAVIQVGWSSTLGVVVVSLLSTLGVIVVVSSTLMVGGHVVNNVGDGGGCVVDIGGG